MEDGRARAHQLNPAAGDHPIADDPREVEAALRAGERTWAEYPYYDQRYGERGRAFTRSDSAWLVTLASENEDTVAAQVAWLGRLLAARGMPRLLLERHLVTLREELVAAVPERAEAYAALARAAVVLADARRETVSDARVAALGQRFDELTDGALPRTGELIAAAAADERAGIAQAVPSLMAWLTEAGWAEAAGAVLAEARRT